MQVKMLFLLLVFGIPSCKPRVQTSKLTFSKQDPEVNWARRMGVEFADAKGLSVSKVFKVSPACVMGLHSGDKIISLNAQPVGSYREFDSVAWANIRGPFKPWCFTVSRRGQEILLPNDCKFKEMIKKPATRKFVCDPWNMRLCGPLTGRCKEDTASKSFRLY